MGIAARMLELILQHARRNGATDAFIEVRLSNKAAIGLYKKLGFAACGVRPRYYDSPKEDAILMKTRI
jgi:ribosomal-protein-alanine N-acetyltransferase